MGKDYKNSTSGPRGNQSSTSFLHTYRILLQVMYASSTSLPRLIPFLSLGKFSLTDFEMKLAIIFAFTLIGAVLASPTPAAERAVMMSKHERALVVVYPVPERSEGTEVSKMAIREGIVFWGVPPL